MNAPALNRQRVAFDLAAGTLISHDHRSKTRSQERVHPGAIEVITRVAREHGLELSDLRSASRAAALVAVRHKAMAEARTHTDASLPQIGDVLARDHTTVLHGLRRMGVS